MGGIIQQEKLEYYCASEREWDYLCSAIVFRAEESE